MCYKLQFSFPGVTNSILEAPQICRDYCRDYSRDYSISETDKDVLTDGLYELRKISHYYKQLKQQLLGEVVVK